MCPNNFVELTDRPGRAVTYLENVPDIPLLFATGVVKILQIEDCIPVPALGYLTRRLRISIYVRALTQICLDPTHTVYRDRRRVG